MLAAIVCTIACMAQPATPAHHYDFRKWFRTLAQNRVEYNRYNDSIFQIRDHDQWTRFLQVRARKNHEINLSNRLIIDSINHAMTVGEVLNDRSLYSEFIRAFTLDYLRAGKADPFNTLTLCDAMQRYSDHQPDSLRMDNWLHLWRGVAYFHIFSLDNDTTTPLQSGARQGERAFSRLQAVSRHSPLQPVELCLVQQQDNDRKTVAHEHAHHAPHAQ